MTAQKTARITGLSVDAAHRAQNRDFSETLTASLPESVWREVKTALNAVGLQCLCGGRFYTITDLDCSKGKAMKQLVQAFQASLGQNISSIGIGDSANDLDMLKTADHAFLVQRPDGKWNTMDVPGLNRVPAIGPFGWVQAVKGALNKH